ncbi:MAG: flagellar hook-length control protein FliK, partial [Bilophila sp.]
TQASQATPNDQAKQRKTGQANQPGQTGQTGQAGVVGQAQPSSGQNEPSGQDAGKDKKNTFMGADNAAKNGLVTAKTVETPANPWDALLQRLDLAPTTAVTNGVTPGKLAHGQAPSPLSGRVLSQVEQGMFSALRDGTKRLELQLNPHDLGSVNVQLISRNGEVSALLRPERPETASLLMQQMDQLRAHLEEQGVKVDKVDVQTQLKDDGGMSWQGMHQHNDAQEQQSRSLDFERFRRLGRTRATDIASNIRPELAGMARTATESLHIVA